VVTENSVRSENTGVPTIREIMAATTMSSLFVALFALIASHFQTRAALQAEISTAAAGSCGLCCTDSGPVGGDVSRWFSPTPFSVGTAELSPGNGPGSRAVFPEGQKLRRTFVI
jgi:hypothetical protein